VEVEKLAAGRVWIGGGPHCQDRRVSYCRQDILSGAGDRFRKVATFCKGEGAQQPHSGGDKTVSMAERTLDTVDRIDGM
jgi:hypothetical protein